MRLADSLGRPMSENVAQQLKQLFPFSIDVRTKKMKVALSPCPRQTIARDCGYFAAAVGLEWASGNELLRSWNDSFMRNHLKTCLETEVCSPFPKLKPLSGRGRKAVPQFVYI